MSTRPQIKYTAKQSSVATEFIITITHHLLHHISVGIGHHLVIHNTKIR